MEHIREALLKADASLNQRSETGPQRRLSPVVTQPAKPSPPPPPGASAWEPRDVRLKPRQMERSRIVAFDMSDSKHVAFNILRTRVRASLREQHWNTIAVTSPTARCGKTTVALNLAFSLARSPDFRVVLVDLDLKKPAVARTLGLEVTGSVGKYLRSEDAIEDCFVRVAPNFVIALNNERIQNSSELIQSPKLDDFIGFIRRTLVPDVILFDLPPMLPSDDALAMLPKIDGALLVAAAGVTTVPEIQACEGQISQLGKLLGVALNKSDVVEEEYSY